MMTAQGYIIGADADGVTIRIPRPDLYHLDKQEVYKCMVTFEDGRHVSVKQIRMIWELMTDVAIYSGYRAQDTETEVYRKYFKPKFKLDILPEYRRTSWSLSNSTVSEASSFISMLADFILQNDVPVREPLWDNVDDVGAYVSSCLIHKRCAVCGKSPVDLHHLDAVGMGADRREADHNGRRCLPLCRVHHNEYHNIGETEFMDKYHMEAGVIDEQVIKLYRLGGKNK